MTNTVVTIWSENLGICRAIKSAGVALHGGFKLKGIEKDLTTGGVMNAEHIS